MVSKDRFLGIMSCTVISFKKSGGKKPPATRTQVADIDVEENAVRRTVEAFPSFINVLKCSASALQPSCTDFMDPAALPW